MKKLLIAFAAIATTIGVNAATMNWGADYTYASGGTGEAGVSRGTSDEYLALVFDAAVTEYSVAQALYAANDGAGLADLAVGSTKVSADDAGYFNATANFQGSTGDTISAYVAIFDASTVAAASNMYLSEVQSAVIPTSGVAGSFTFGDSGDMIAMASSSAWTAASSSVPEPTSGLLLLIGMAGLALKRKRA